MSVEQSRLQEGSSQKVPPWMKWGPYVSERAWGTVREDYSANGDAWSYFPYDLAYSKAYRWGEDGIAGFCDRYQILVLAPVFWNGKDPMLKERLFGLSSHEGNHGEDVKEVYFHLDATPSHSYLKYLYKYPQAPFPYELLREKNRGRSREDPEYELIDTGIFAENRYFDLFIEYAKADSEDLCIKVTICNRAKEPAPFHLLMQLWFRNQWSWSGEVAGKPWIVEGPSRDCLLADDRGMNPLSNLDFEYRLGARYLYGPSGSERLFTENETGLKEAFHHTIIGKETKVGATQGTKGGLHYFLPEVPALGSTTLLFRFCPCEKKDPLQDVEAIIAKRKQEADEFYDKSVHPPHMSEEEKQIQRQALAGLVWNKQIYLYDVDKWLDGDNAAAPPPKERKEIRNVHWRHLNSMRILLMPDKWEYPWFAAWDHAFHCIAYSLLDKEFAKEQLWLLLFDQFQHPNGEIPAYEWEFSDLNPPVQGWAAFRLYELDGKKDRAFLERCFHKLLINFAWWVNRVDVEGNNIFEGGFLGFDNIAVIDRSEQLPGGAVLNQSDGTGWMAMFSLNLMRIALELSLENRVYESLATKFFQHYVYIANGMKKRRGEYPCKLWNDQDRFFYDVLFYPDGRCSKFRIRSLVGLIPLFVLETLHEEEIRKFPEFYANFHWFLNNRKDLVSSCVIPASKEGKRHFILAPMNEEQLESVLRYVWDPAEFRAEYGLRSMSRVHEKNPFVFEGKQVGYEPSESRHAIKGGNSNWRGPVWIPITFLLVESLLKLSEAFDQMIVKANDADQGVDLLQMARFFSSRISSLFLMNGQGMRPVWGPGFPFAQDPHWKDYISFYEYYNPETGKGLGARNQTGWSALVANLLKVAK